MPGCPSGEAWGLRSQDRDAGEPGIVVVTDTTVLVNVIHIDRTELFARIPDYEFILP